jgi:ketopantoate reductase
MIAATLDEKHEIVHLNRSHSLIFGERDGSMSERVEAVANLMSGARFDVHPSTTILLDMEKWVFLAALPGSTCLIRGGGLGSRRRLGAHPTNQPRVIRQGTRSSIVSATC